MKLLFGGFFGMIAMQVAIISAGNALLPPESPREYLIVTTPDVRHAVERADAQERRALQAESDNAMLAVENAILRDQLRRASAGGVQVAGGEVRPEDMIPATNLPVGP